MNIQQKLNTQHIPILVSPIVEALSTPFLELPANADPHWLVDATLGGGGHTSKFLELFASNPMLSKHRVLSLDQDLGAVERARDRFFREIQGGQLEIRHVRFGDSMQLVAERPVLGLLADLGFSSDQMADSSRGLSFQSDGPLDMRLDPSQGTPCAEYLKEVEEGELERILREYGDERFSRRIAQAIVRSRELGQLPATPRELSVAIVKAIPPFARHGRIHAATRTFQALRMAVNDELGQLEGLLRKVLPEMKRGGRAAIMSFHSVEDRMVKHTFKEDGFRPITKKPIEPNDQEISENPRSRSAKLRVAEILAGNPTRDTR